MSATEAIVENGSPVIIARSDEKTFHLPARVRVSIGFPPTLDEVLEKGGCPSSWLTRCGLRGDVYLYRDLFNQRRPCPHCLASDV